MWRPPDCGDGNELRNARWHAAYAVLAVGSAIFHIASVLVHLRRNRNGRA